MQVHIQQEPCRKKILNLDWSVLFHPPYSSDLTSSDFHLFHSLQNALNDKEFSHEDQEKTLVESFLISKPSEFYLRKLKNLPNKWQEVIQNNGEYIVN